MLLTQIRIILLTSLSFQLVSTVKKNIECFSSPTQLDCLSNEILVEGAGLLGICPACKTGAKKGKNCENVPCAPGLKCKKKCIMEDSGCFKTRHIDDQIILLPFCDADNTFSAVQCKGDRVTGRCFCSTETGEKIFGWDWWRNAKDMTCACSRWRHKLEADGFMGAFLHCSQNGNYEEMQCTTKFCWCAEPKTGEVKHGTRIVPWQWWKRLPCYDPQKYGDTYQRQCESINFIASILIELYQIRGTTAITLRNTVCEYDGAFGGHVVENGLVYCLWRDGSKIDPYSAVLSELGQIDCGCARDKMTFQLAGTEFTSSCTAGGAYRSVQQESGKYYCADKDGYAASPPLVWVTETDCEGYFWYADDD